MLLFQPHSLWYFAVLVPPTLKSPSHSLVLYGLGVKELSLHNLFPARGQHEGVELGCKGINMATKPMCLSPLEVTTYVLSLSHS